MLFINTRPEDRAQALTRCLEQANFTVLEMPVLELSARSFDQTLKDLYLQLPQAQIIVVVSPKAVEVGMAYLKKSGLSIDALAHIQWIAVGEKTAQALAKWGIESLVPEVETSEGMLTLPIFEHLQPHQKIVFWRGEGGRQFMMQQCREKQFEVLNFVLYERFSPKNTAQIFTSFVAQFAQFELPYWICISSEASWKNWLTLSQAHLTILQSGHYLVLGERLYHVLKDAQETLNIHLEITRIDHLDPDVILQTIEDLKRNL